MPLINTQVGAQKYSAGSTLLLSAGIALLMISAAEAQSETQAAAGNGAENGVEKSVFGHLAASSYR